MESQIESHLITYSLGLQLSRGWRVWGPCHLCGRPSWTVVNWNLIYLSPYLAHYQSNSRLSFILPSEAKKNGKSTIFHFFSTSFPGPVMQSTELLICLWAVNMVHHWHCSRMVRADHRAQFDTNLVYCALTLAEVHNAEIPASHRGGCQVGIQAVKTPPHKELLNCPKALWVLHLSLYPFNISCPGPSHALAKCLCLGYWNMDESTHLPIYLDVSGKRL